MIKYSINSNVVLGFNVKVMLEKNFNLLLCHVIFLYNKQSSYKLCCGLLDNTV